MNKYGPNTVQVELFIDRLKVLTDKEVKRIAARDTAREATWDAARSAAWDAAWDAARGAAWDAIWEATRNITRNTAWDAARDATWDVAWNTSRAARAIVVMDLITEEQFTILTEPFAEILVELGIVWKPSEVGDGARNDS
jgi:hypothetical protein